MIKKRFAVFVEGKTELEFSIKLLFWLAGAVGIKLNIFEQHKGDLVFLNAKNNGINQVSIEVLIVNCHSDERVKTEINNQYDTLASKGYSLIIGLRDVYPRDIQRLKKLLPIGLRNSDELPVHLHLAIMEIEAWFLAELTHFKKINESITEHKIISNGFDFNKTHAHNIPHPAETLKQIYQSVGEEYDKNMEQIKRTVNALDYDNMYINVRQKSPSLDGFITSLEQGLKI